MAKKVKNRAAAKDFTAEMLPHNRKQQFFNILKNRVPLILKSAIIIFVFFIPFILAASYKTVVIYGFYKQYSGGAISYENMLGYINYTEFLSSLVFVPCLTLASVPIAGVNRITRRLIFGEGILYKEDFIAGIKESGKSYALFALFASAIYALLRFFVFYNGGGVISVVTLFVAAVIAIPYLITLITYNNVYSSRGAELIRNALFAMIKSKWKILVISAALVVPYAMIRLFSSGYLFLILLCLYVLLAPVYLLFTSSMFAGTFDEAFNYLNHEEIVKKGLYISNKERENIHLLHLRKVEELKKGV